MPLHINLYHEKLTREIHRKRDPLKLSMYALAGVAALLIGYYAFRQGQVGILKREIAAKTAKAAELEPQAAAARKEAAELQVLINTSDALMSRIETRFYWAPLFEEIVKVAPKEVQITSLNGEAQRDKPGTFIVMVSGLASSNSPRTAAEDFRTSLLRILSAKYKQTTAAFRSLDESSEQVVVDGQQRPAVNFTIYIRNNDTTADAQATASKP
jgi:Tfp pilus assembly protein PilN